MAWLGLVGLGSVWFLSKLPFPVPEYRQMQLTECESYTVPDNYEVVPGGKHVPKKGELFFDPLRVRTGHPEQSDCPLIRRAIHDFQGFAHLIIREKSAVVLPAAYALTGEKRPPRRGELFLDAKRESYGKIIAELSGGRCIRLAGGDHCFAYPIVRDTWTAPAWLKAAWIAMDADGSWFGYDAEPQLVNGEWTAGGADCSYLGLTNFVGPHCDDFTKSKRRITKPPVAAAKDAAFTNGYDLLGCKSPYDCFPFKFTLN